jgi:hypothetical protein
MLHRAILQAPFTPFTVIFCNVILHCDPFDLNTLSDFVSSIESCRTVSEGADKLYKMCHLFLQVAKLYVEAKTNEYTHKSSTQPQESQSEFYQAGGEEQDFDLNSLAQFDPYLSALGLMPNSVWPMTNYAPTGGDEDESMHPEGFQGRHGMGTGSMPVGMQSDNTVQNWFSGSRYLMNLMEEDTRMPDFSI